jgi:hypothetical protein
MMEKLIKNLLDEGYSIMLYNAIEDRDSYFIDMKKNGKRMYFSVKKEKANEFENFLETTIEQLAKQINSKKNN